MIRYWHWLVAQKKKEELPTEYVVRGTAINNAEFSPDYDGYDDYVSELDRRYVDYYYDTDNIKEGETIKVYYYYDYQTYKYVYCYIENGEVIEYIPPKPTYENGITFKVKFKTDGVEDNNYTQISCNISPEGNWEFTYPLNKKIYSLDEFCNESDYSYTEYGVISDGDAILLSVDFSDSDGLRNLHSMDNAFKGCYKLQTITFGQTSLPSLESASDAFFDCNLIPSAITKVLSAPNLVGDVGEYSFFKDNIHYYNVGNSLRVDGYNNDMLSNVVIPSSITICNGHTYNVTEIGITSTIGRCAFLNANITTISLPNTITRIGICAFRNCSSLQSINIPNSVTHIGTCAFTNCSNLASISLSNTITELRLGTFAGCSSLTSISLPNTIQRLGINMEEWKYDDLFEDDLLEYNLSEHDNYFADGNTTIEHFIFESYVGVFQGCSSMTSIAFSNQLRIIGSDTFNGCGLTEIVIPNSVTTIYGGYTSGYINSEYNNYEVLYPTFGGSTISVVKIPNSVTTIPDVIFESVEQSGNKNIYCQAQSKPDGWTSEWCANITNITWGATW